MIARTCDLTFSVTCSTCIVLYCSRSSANLSSATQGHKQGQGARASDARRLHLARDRARSMATVVFQATPGGIDVDGEEEIRLRRRAQLYIDDKGLDSTGELVISTKRIAWQAGAQQRVFLLLTSPS